MRNSTLSPEDAAWLAETVERNKTRFEGWSMLADADDDKDDDDTDEDSDDDSDDDDKDDDDTDDWKAKFEAQQRINRTLERRTRKDAAKLKQLQGAKPGDKPKGDPDEKVDAAQIRKEAEAEARQAVLRDRVEDKIEAKARAFADPETAVAVLLRKHDIDDFLDDGKIDVEAITDALKELGEKQPNLLAQGGKKFKGDPDGGTRKATTERPKSLGDAIATHYKPRK